MAQVNDIRSLIKQALNEYYKKYQIKMSDAPAPTDKNPAIKIIEDGSIYIVGVGNYTGGTLANKKTLQQVLASTSKINDEAGPTSTTETYSAAKITELIGNVSFNIQIVSSLPSTGDEHTIYLVLSESAGTQNIYDEWLYVHSGEQYVWEKIGSTAANLDNYYTKDQIDASFYTKEYVNASFYDKDHIDVSFYDKDRINASFYDKAWIDSSFSNIPQSQLKAGQNVSISVNGSINAIGYVYNENSSSFSVGRSLAIGQDSFAEGYDTSAEGKYSHAAGYKTIANSSYMTAIGSYNSTSTGSMIGGDYLFVVGNGSDGSHRSNAFAVTTNGATANHIKLAGGPYQNESDPDPDPETYRPGGKLSFGDASLVYLQETDEDELTIFAKNGLKLKTSEGSILLQTEDQNSIFFRNNDDDGWHDAKVLPNGSMTATVNNVSNVYLGCPIGTIVMWSGETAPEGWLLCNGDKIFGTWTDVFTPNIPRYKPICDVIGVKYGSGSNYIQLPDLQQKFPIGASTGTIGINNSNSRNGWDTSLGSKGGEAVHKLLVSEMPSHKHDLYVDNDGTSQSTRYTIHTTEESIYSKASDWNGASGTRGTIPEIMFTAGQDSSHNNIPPFVALNFIIKYQ